MDLSPLPDRPLVTFALFAYNHKEFIREAVEAAFAQTYSPLEIILSDDCSSDATFYIMAEMVRNYRGPHSIVLAKNDINLGIGAHVNRAMTIAKGDLIVLAAGDDVSCESRVEDVVHFWLRNGRKPDAMWSDVVKIDRNGNQLGVVERKMSADPIADQVREMCPDLLGCSSVVTKRLCNAFGSLSHDLVYEDRVLAFRALCLGGLGRIDKILVKYRILDSSVSNYVRENYFSRQTLTMETVHVERKITVFKNYLVDLNSEAVVFGDQREAERLREVIQSQIRTLSLRKFLLENDFRKRLDFVRSHVRKSASGSVGAIYILMAINPMLYLLFRYMFVKLRSGVKRA